MATKAAVSPNYQDVNAVINGGTDTAGVTWSASATEDATHKQWALDGDTVTVPNGAATWGDGIAANNRILTIAKDIQLIGNNGVEGMDETHATPDASRCTIITARNTTGGCIVTNYKGSDNVCRISSFVFELTRVGGSYFMNIAGKAYRRWNAGHTAIIGGFRMDHCRWKNSADPAGGPYTVATGAKLIVWGAQPQGAGVYITGSFDHNFWDYQRGSSGSELVSFACSGAPLGATGGDGRGQYNWAQDYTYGDDDPQITYIEDNICHRSGVFIDTLGGGIRMVGRYNTTWGCISTHGIDGSNCGPASCERYNNWFDNTIKVTSFAAIDHRGGASVTFNNRFTTTTGEIAGQTYRPFSALSTTIGPATGRNFLDENYKGNQTFNGFNFVPIRATGLIDDLFDQRIGSIYAKGTNAVVRSTGTIVTYRLTATGIGVGPHSNKWLGFVIVSVTCVGGVSAGDGSNGDQGAAATHGGQPQAFIESSTWVDDNTVDITMKEGGNAWFTQTGGTPDPFPVDVAVWEIRRVKTYFCNPGSGKMLLANGGDNYNNFPNTGDVDTSGFAFKTGSDATYDSPLNKHKYWSKQVGFGTYQAFNLARTTSSGIGSTWIAPPGITGTNSASTVNGDAHDDVLPTYRKNDKNGMFGGNPYPPMGVQDATTLRIGAHWHAPGYDGITFPKEGIDWTGSTPGECGTAYGQPYPNPMVSPIVPVPRITSDSALKVLPSASVSFQVKVADFSGTPTYSLVAGQGTFTGSGVSMSGSGLISGTASATAGSYPVQIKATLLSPAESATQDFALTIVAAPTISITNPTASQSFLDTATIPLQSSASVAAGATLTKVDYYYDATPNPILIQSIDPGTTPSPYTYQWSGMAAGSYSLTAVATDSNNLTKTSAAIAITVTTQVVTGLTAPTIVVSA